MNQRRPNGEQAVLLSRVLESIRAHHPAWNVKKLTLAGAGLTCIVGRARTSTLGSLAIRIPRKRILSYTIDQRLSARALLKQEELLARTVETQRVPVPTVHALHLEDRGTDFLVSAFIEHDHSSASPRDLGELLRCIHGVSIPRFVPALRSAATIRATLAERISRRLRLVRHRAPAAAQAPGQGEMEEMLSWPDERTALLHMDYRAANVLCRAGRIGAVIDWSNALIGDPALELARVFEYGYVAPVGSKAAEFARGYGSGHDLRNVPRVVEALYRLDTAVMLCVLFDSVLRDDRRALVQAQRVTELLRSLREVLIPRRKAVGKRVTRESTARTRAKLRPASEGCT